MASKTPTTPHVFIVSFPAQGQVNPLLRLGKRLASKGGFLVTFATTAPADQKIIKGNGITPGQLYPIGDGFLRFDFFDIGGARYEHRSQFSEFYPKLEFAGRKGVPEMLGRLAEEGRPVSCLINGTLVPWVCDIAEEKGIPLVTMWTQSCTSFLTFYYSYNQLVPFPTEEHPYTDVEIPTLPLLKWDELHSFLHPAYPYPCTGKAWLHEFRNLNKPLCILMDTFDELERETIQFTARLCPTIKPVGPLFRDPIAPNFADLGANPQKADSSCLDWLDSKSRHSVVYICFGSTAHLKQEQVDEITHGILNMGAPFLWVMRTPNPDSNLKPHALPVKVEDNGRVVEYSPQEQVLAHPSVACFVTHCGWNSTIEALTSGVPMVAFPQWGDQLTGAKLLVDVLRVAVRMGRGEHDDQVVPREEVERCIREATVGPRAEERPPRVLPHQRHPRPLGLRHRRRARDPLSHNVGPILHLLPHILLLLLLEWNSLERQFPWSSLELLGTSVPM